MATSDGGIVGGQTDSADETDVDSTDNAGSDNRLDPRVREHVEQHGSPAYGYDHAPES